MAELLFSEQADAQLDELEADPARQLLVGRLHTALDQLERDPGAAECRRRRFPNIGVWGISVVADGDEWLILWEPGDATTTTQDTVIVRAITPAP